MRAVHICISTALRFILSQMAYRGVLPQPQQILRIKSFVVNQHKNKANGH